MQSRPSAILWPGNRGVPLPGWAAGRLEVAPPPKRLVPAVCQDVDEEVASIILLAESLARGDRSDVVELGLGGVVEVRVVHVARLMGEGRAWRDVD